MIVSRAPEDQLSGQKMATPQMDDQDTSDSSEDDDEAIQGLCSKMPFDLGFTLIGMDVRESDFRTLKKLRMDLDTFLTLSEEELLELGVKHSSGIKKVISDKSVADCLHEDNFFFKPKIRDLRMSSDESCILLKNVFAQIETVRKYLQELQFILSTDPPVNYVVTKEKTSTDIFGRSALTALILATELRQELKCLERKCDPSQDEAWDKAKRGKLEAENKVDENCSEDSETEFSTTVNIVGKLKSSKRTFIYNTALALTTSGLSTYALWKLWKLLISTKN